MAKVNSSRFNFKEDIDWAVKQYLREYDGDVMEMTYKTIKEVAQEAVKKLRTQEKTPKRTGKYAKGWTYRMERGRANVGAIVYGKSGTYQLAHLLEHGHAIIRGGRKVGDAEAKEHIYGIDQWAVDEAYDRIVERLNSF